MKMKQMIVGGALVALLTAGPLQATAATGSGFNSEYVFATTRSVSEMDMNPVIVHADGCAIADALCVPLPAHNVIETKQRKAR